MSPNRSTQKQSAAPPSAKKMPIIFASFSKHTFYLRHQVSAFVIHNGGVPINPFMNYDYNLSGLVDKNLVRVANNTMIPKCDELWVFGKVSDGVLVEVFLAKRAGKPVRFFLPHEDVRKFREISIDEVQMEDVSPWIWEWVVAGKNLARWHPRLRLTKTYPLIFPAYSKRNFYWQMHISAFCIEKLVVPLNPFMLFRYFLGDVVPRETIYEANSHIVALCDELWAIGDISDGVLAEILQAKKQNKKVEYIKIIDDGSPVKFRKISPAGATFEEDKLEKFRGFL